MDAALLFDYARPTRLTSLFEALNIPDTMSQSLCIPQDELISYTHQFRKCSSDHDPISTACTGVAAMFLSIALAPKPFKLFPRSINGSSCWFHLLAPLLQLITWILRILQLVSVVWYRLLESDHPSYLRPFKYPSLQY